MLSPDRSSSPRKPTFRDETIVVRSAEDASREDRAPEDRAFISSVAHQAFLVYGSYDEFLEEWLDNDAVLTMVAEVEGERVGFYMLTYYHDEEGSNELIADLVAIAVAPEYQSRGVGKRLLAHAFSLAAGAAPPVREVWLVVAEGNMRAQRFFGRHGFRLREGVGVYPAGQRALRMVRPLEVKS